MSALASSQGPLDLSGPEFLKLYVGVLAAALLVGFLLRRSLASPHGEDVSQRRELDVLCLAYLRGGALAVVETALLALERQGLARAGGRGFRRIDPVGGLVPTFPSQFVADVYAKLALDRPRRAAYLVRRVPEPPFVDHLRERGLVIEADRGRLVRLLGVLPMLLAVGFGLLKLQVGIERERPVSLLIGLLLIACLLAVVSARPVRLTGRGRRQLATSRRAQAALRVAANRDHKRLEPADLCLAFSLFGGTFLRDTALGRAFGPQATSSPAPTGSSCGGGGCGSGGGCGGGGGGGGCGGCGG